MLRILRDSDRDLIDQGTIQQQCRMTIHGSLSFEKVHLYIRTVVTPVKLKSNILSFAQKAHTKTPMLLCAKNWQAAEP